jgi:2-oxoisovalerate dehydrogenase E1 component
MHLVGQFISKLSVLLGVGGIEAANGHSQAPAPAAANHGQLLEAYTIMVRARRNDEKAIVLYKQNKCHFQIGCAGHEAIQVAAAQALKPKYDWAYPYYRDMAFCAAWGMTNREFLLNAMNKAADPNSGGRQMPMHYGHKDLNIINQSSPTGTQFLQAVGTAQAMKLRGSDAVVYVSAGEGTCAQGDWHEALNWAARQKLPVVFVVQDNKFAISVHISEQHAGGVEDISSGYRGLEVVKVNGLDYLESEKVMNTAVSRARRGDGPTVVVAEVVRLQSHSISDNQAKYRKPEDIESDKELDPIELLRTHLIKNGISTAAQLDAIAAEIQKEINADSNWAEEQPDPAPHSWSDFVLKNPTPWVGITETPATGESMFMVDSLNRALVEEMERNKDILVFGQDVAYGKGGVFSVTVGLSDKFGAKRCFNSPLAEASIVGTGIGMAVVGMKPVVEIQFGDYIWTAMMQLRNELAMMHYRSNGTFSAPMVVRVAVGGYIHGAIYHSQSIEGTFAVIPGLHVVFPSNATDAKGLLKAAIRSEDPVLFLEHKGLYRQIYAKGPIGGADDLIPIGKARVARAGKDATVIAWGMLVHKALAAAEKLSKEGADVEVIDLRTIAPLDTDTIIRSVAKTGRVLVAQEDQKFAGFGSEVASQIAELAFERLDAPIMRIGSKRSPVAHAASLEDVILPQTADVIDSLRKLLAY